MWAISPPSFTRMFPATYEENTSPICGSIIGNRRTETGLEKCFGAKKLPVAIQSKYDDLEARTNDCCPNTLKSLTKSKNIYFDLYTSKFLTQEQYER